MHIRNFVIILGLASCLAAPANAAMRITEWMYNPSTASGFEFVELTNLGPGSVDMTGWSFDDSTGVAGSLSLSSLGVVAQNESVVITDGTAAAFRTEWSLLASVKVVGGSLENLSRDDGITIFNASNTLVDSLFYNDQGAGNLAGPRTSGKSGNPLSYASLGANNATLWKLAAAGDVYGSTTSAHNDIGNPGRFQGLVPEPTTAGLATAALLAIGGMRRKRRVG